MLCGIHDSHPVEYIIDEEKEPILLRQNDRHVLLKTVNRFKLGRLEFKLVYEHTEDEARITYTEHRNIFFQAGGLLPPHPRLGTHFSEHSYSLLQSWKFLSNCLFSRLEIEDLE